MSPKPQDLHALAQDMGKWRQTPESGVFLIVISLSASLPETKRVPALIGGVSDSIMGVAAKRGATAYHVTSSDFAILVKALEAALTGIVRDLKVETLRAFEVGNDLGIQLFQGFLVDEMLSKQAA